MPDAHKNFAYSTVATAPSPAASGTELVVASGNGTLFPAVPFNATVWPTGVQPTSANAEILRVTGISTDTFTIERTQEGTSARTIVVGDQIAASITAKTFTDIEVDYANSWSPFFIQTGTGLATYASTAALSTGSVFLMPITLCHPVRFNQILIGNSLTIITTANTSTAQNTYQSHFGLYSLASNTLFSLISSNSFSMGLSLRSNDSMSVNFPTSTATTGYGYGSLAGTGVSLSAQRTSLFDGTRVIGLQFGGELSLSGGQYWLGVLQLRSTGNTNSGAGLSHMGVVGQIISPINLMDTRSGLMPLGYPHGMFTNSVFSNTGWWGRHMMGLVQNTIVANYGGTHMPNNITLSQLMSPTVIATVIPNLTLVST